MEEEREGRSPRWNPQDRGWDGGGGVPRGQGDGESQSPAALGPPSPGADGSGKGFRTHAPEGILTSRRGHLQPHLVLELRPGVGFELAGGAVIAIVGAARRPAELPSCTWSGARRPGRLAACASAGLILTVDYIFSEDSVVCPFTCLICN